MLLDTTRLADALRAERDRSARQVIFIRAAGALPFLALTAAYIWAPGFEVAGRAGLPLALLNAAVAFALLVLVRRRPDLTRWTWLAIPFFDTPLLFANFYFNLLRTPVPGAAAGMAVGLFLMLTALAQLSLDWRLIGASGAAGIALELLMLDRAGLSLVSFGGGAAFVLVLNTAILCVLPGRLAFVVREIVQERVTKERLGRYFSPEVAREIAERSAGTTASARRITVLFSDLRDFTRLSETMSPAQVAALLDEYHGAMVETLFAHGGTLDKFIGDGLMAYFGAPRDQADHAARAVRCALAMRVRLQALNLARAARGEPPLAFGVGLHTGEAIVGDIGPAVRKEYTAVGDAVNLASRLESATKQRNVDLVVSSATRSEAGESFSWRALGTLEVRGKSGVVEIHTLEGG